MQGDGGAEQTQPPFRLGDHIWLESTRFHKLGELQCEAGWWNSSLKSKSDNWMDEIYLKVCADHRINI